MLTGDSERLPAGREQADFAAAPQEGIGQAPAGADYMLAVVEDKQNLFCAEGLNESVEDCTVRGFFYPDRGRDGRCNQPRIGEGRKLSQPDAVA